MESPERRRTWPWAVAALSLPFVFFWWLLPGVGSGTLGMDYARFSLPQQQELFFSVAKGTFPLYVPGFQEGQSASALTLGQLYHPQSWLAVLLPGYWDGYAQEWNTLLRLVSLGAAHFVLFLALRRFGIGDFLAFVLSLVCVHNLRMLNVFHMAAALESYTAFLAAGGALLLFRLEPERRRWRVLLVIATFLCVVGGHPQSAFYGMLGIGLVLLVTPAFVRAVLGGERDRAADLRHQARAFGLVGLGVLLAAAYAIPFRFEFLADNAARVGQDYTWALEFADTFRGTLASFFQPLDAATSSAFGGTSLWLVAALLPLLPAVRVRVPGVVWLLWGLALLLFLHAQGDRTPVHYLFWKVFPLASSVRGPGRITYLLPLVLALILVWLARAPLFRVGGREVAPLSGLALVAAPLLVVYAALPDELTRDPVRNTATVIHSVTSGTLHLVVIAGVLALIALPFSGPRGLRLASTVLLLATGVQAGISLRFGTWIWPKEPAPTLAELEAEKRESLEFRGNPGWGLGSAVVQRHVEHSCLEPLLARLYHEYVAVDTVDEAYEVIDRGRSPDVVVVVEPQGDPLEVAAEPGGDAPDRVELVEATYNRLVLEVRAGSPGHLGLGYPWSPRLKATVDGVDAEVVRANGATHAVRVPAGESRVEFRYASRAALLGTALSGLTLALVLAWSTRRRFRFGPPLAALFFVGGWTTWHDGLYGGESLGTRYVWEPGPQPTRPNLAYARPTRMATLFQGTQYEDRVSSGRGVDGDTRPGSGFTTAEVRRPFWVVDLGTERAVDSVVVHGDASIPLFVEVSLDGQAWNEVARAPDGASGRVELALEAPASVRWLRVRSSGVRALSLDEVEVFGP